MCLGHGTKVTIEKSIPAVQGNHLNVTLSSDKWIKNEQMRVGETQEMLTTKCSIWSMWLSRCRDSCSPSLVLTSGTNDSCNVEGRKEKTPSLCYCRVGRTGRHVLCLRSLHSTTCLGQGMEEEGEWHKEGFQWSWSLISLHHPSMKNSLSIIRYFSYSLKTAIEIIMTILGFTIE